MQRRASAVVSTIGRHHQLLRQQQRPPCDVFINHRGVDTKKNVAGLLYHHLRGLGIVPFLDSKSMKAGDRLFDKIDVAIGECKVGIAVFSPMYCDSYFCLHELSLMTQLHKRIVPVFCDVKPSELRVKDDGSRPPEDLRSFRAALQEAKYTVGLTFDTLRGDWPEFLANATDVVIKNLIEVEEEEEELKKRTI
ncbi:probable 2' cyclic ADP-D-ribose synthase BdTIR [Salvia miltiorrhiza]|uniref:probable 2' cyclic ADP-D-ribose synthase BdTIR n=1 Tax=Salvia miltiorrhiza TaxID=226208 RepID=UPI0025AD3035|nr:probable 2' cyclic ADP-D-ribose synthase BdTIR [Salvia miltiorrhiza]